MIDALGGLSRVAELLTSRLGFDVKPSQVANWRRRGVAWHARPALADEAARRGISVPADFLFDNPSADRHGRAGLSEEASRHDAEKRPARHDVVPERELRSADELQDLPVGPNGRINLPQRFLDAAGIREGDVIEASLEGDVIKLIGLKAAIRLAQELVAKYVPPGVSLVDELIAERRREAEEEDDGY